MAPSLRQVRPDSVVEVAPVTVTATSSPGWALPVKFTVTCCRVRPRSVCPWRLLPSTSTSTVRPTETSATSARLRLCLLHEALHARSSHLLGDLLRQGGRGGARPRRVDEREGGVEPRLADQRERLLEVVVALAGKAGDEVGGERHVRDRRA